MRKISLFFAGLTSGFSPLSRSDVTNIYVPDVPGDLLVTTHEAYKALRAIQVKKAPGPDAIPNIILKRFARPVMAELYHTSLQEGYLTPLLKSATVCPLPKQKPPRSIEDDIRPVSLTCQTAKLMEGFTLAKILPGILSELDTKEFAIAGKSTGHDFAYLLHLALEALDNGKFWVRFFFADFR